MKRGIAQQLCAAALLVGWGSSATLAETGVGKPIADFTLRSHRGREWSLNDFADQKVVVIAFLGTECPLVKLYGTRLAEMREQFADRGVEFIGINSNTQDSLTEMTAFADRYKITFPLLKDLGNRVADAIGAERTPEIFVLDEERKVRYHGRIDDQYGVGYSRGRADRNDLAIAIEELLAGKPVSLPETNVIGCHIGRVSNVEASGDVTYSNQIARIFNKPCVECHRDGEIAPFTLTKYDDIIGWEDTIVEVIRDNRMPPWFANPEHGKFHNDARLTQEEKQLIYDWVENGIPEGDPADLPAPAQFVRGWRIPQPDQVFHMRELAFEVPAQGTVDYQHFLVDPKWDEDRYIYAAEARPDNTSVVHHILVYVLRPDQNRNADLRSILVGYAPGSTPVLLTDGLAIRVPAGSKLLFQLHYTPNGHKQLDRSYAGVCFIDQADVKKTLNGRLAINTNFRIPPHESNHVVTANYQVRQDEMLLSMTPHMHLRGSSFRYEATYPNGEKDVLLDVPNYDFNWQLKYTLAEPKLLPKGTSILCTASFDNSEDNLVNPAPEKTVSWGDQSWEEMMIGFFTTIPADRKDEVVRSTNVAIDPSGKWSWERSFGGRKAKETLSLTLQDEVLSGVLETKDGEVNIRDAVIDGDRLNFQVSLPQFGGVILDFDAKVSETKLTGNVTFSVESIGNGRTFPWEAQRTE